MTFVFNDSGVCTNPELVLSWRKGRDYFEIEAAQGANGKWAGGCSHHCGNGGGGHGASLKWGQYDSRNEVVAAEAKALITRLKSNMNEPENKQPVREMIREIENRLNDYLTPQLSLF